MKWVNLLTSSYLRNLTCLYLRFNLFIFLQQVKKAGSLCRPAKDECDFPESNRQDLNHYEQVELGAFDQEKVGFSLLNHYKKVINVRNKYPFIKNSVSKNLTSKIETKNENILAYELTYNDERIVVIHNFSYFNSTIDLKGVASEIVDVISQLNYIPELDGSTLKIGQKTTLVLK